MQLITVYTIAEAACLITALYCLRREGWNIWGLQRAYLVVVLATELVGTYMRGAAINNLPLYNIFILIEGAVISTVLRGMLQPLLRRHLGPWFWGWLVLFGSVWALEWSTSPAEYVYLNYTVALMSLVFFVACGIYFYRLLLTTPQRSISRHGPFWWVSGTAIFYLGGFMVNLALDLLIEVPVYVDTVLLHDIINGGLNLALYSLWGYSYITRFLNPSS